MFDCINFNVCRVEITIDGDVMSGVACDLESRGFKALCKATEEVVGSVHPYSITGSLPLIRDLQVNFLLYSIFLCTIIEPSFLIFILPP